MTASVAFCCSIGAGQVIMTPSPDNTLSVTVTGSAESPADWAELNFTVQGQGATAQEALAVCDESWQKLLDELAALGVAEGSIRSGPPEIGPDSMTQMMVGVPGPGEGEVAKQTVRRNVAVRLAQTDPQALYEGICRLIDAASDAGAALKAPGPMQQVYSQGAMVTFGVNDPKPLRTQAIGNGLTAAKEVAEVVATSAGRTLGDIAGIQVAELGPEAGYLGMIGEMFSQPKPGRAVASVSLTVTYRLK